MKLFEAIRTFKSNLTRNDIIRLLIESEFKLLNEKDDLLILSPVFQFSESKYAVLRPRVYLSVVQSNEYTKISLWFRMSFKQKAIQLVVTLFVLFSLLSKDFIEGIDTIPLWFVFFCLFVFNSSAIIFHFFYGEKSIDIVQELVHRNSSEFERIL